MCAFVLRKIASLSRAWATGALSLALVLPALSAEFIVGADMSHLVFFEDRGITYKDSGQVGDALEILRERGLNCVRLRLFTSSEAQAQADPYNYTNNMTYTLPLAVRVKNAGMKFLLDFHFSDTWADPKHQSKPAEWSSLPYTQLVQQVRTYSSNSVWTFKSAGAMPDYIQVGNEITPGMLWPDGANTNSSQWNKFAQLLTSSIQGIRDASGTNMPKIIVHIERGGDWETTQWFFDSLAQRSVAFDIIGQSYYPWWHGSLTNLEMCLSNTAARYGKPVLIAETAFPWTNSTNVFGIPATTNGQVQFVAELARIVKSIPQGLGAGVLWWGTEYQRVNGVKTASFEYRSFFGTGGDVLPVATALGELGKPATLSASLLGTELKLAWSLSGAGMKLRTATNLTSTGWSLVTNPVISTNAMFTLNLAVEPGQRFFRLQSQ
jgi:arabinogalactan endo-1,4-beta-galactosidase